MAMDFNMYRFTSILISLILLSYLYLIWCSACNLYLHRCNISYMVKVIILRPCFTRSPTPPPACRWHNAYPFNDWPSGPQFTTNFSFSCLVWYTCTKTLHHRKSVCLCFCAQNLKIVKTEKIHCSFPKKSKNFHHKYTSNWRTTSERGP